MKKIGEVAKALAEELVRSGFAEKAEVAGSIRRGEVEPTDIDIVCGLANMKSGTMRVYRLKRDGFNVQLFAAAVQHFGAMWLCYTGPKGSNIGLRIKAKKRGFKLNQYGLWRGGENLASKTEEAVLAVLGHSWKEPGLRGR